MSPFSVSKTLLALDDVTSVQRVGECCHLASHNLKNGHVFSNNFHVSTCFHSREKNQETLDLERTTYFEIIVVFLVSDTALFGTYLPGVVTLDHEGH